MDKSRFFGRDSELGRFEDLLERVLNGSGQTAFVAGESGTGKSTLIEAFIAQAQKRSSALLATMTTCNSQTGQSDAFLPFLETLSQLTGDVDRFKFTSVGRINSDRIGHAKSVTSQFLIEDAPELIGGFIPAGSFVIDAVRHTAEEAGWEDKFELILKKARLEGKIESEKVFQLYTDLLLKLSKHVPLVLAIDDLHWVDPSSAQLFFHLSRRIAGAPILLLGSYRPNDVALGRDSERHPMLKVLHEVKRASGDIVIELGKESAPERESFVNSLLDSVPNKFDEKFRRLFLEHTDGHPLFSGELIKSFQERGIIILDEEGRWVQSCKIDWEELPPRVEGVVEERINRLPDDQREVLNIASVQGYHFLAQIVGRLRNINDRDLLKKLSQELEKRHGLVIEDDTARIYGQQITRYHFSHHLFQTYVYKELSKGERMFLHAEVGEIIEEIYGDRKDDMAVQLAYHFGEAEKWEKAISYSLIAVRRFLKVSSYDSAFKHLMKALGKTGELESKDSCLFMLEIYLSMGGIHQALKGYTHPIVEQTYTKAYRLASDSNFPTHRAFAIYGLWTINLFKLNLDKAFELGREIEAIALSEDDSVLKVIAYRALANVRYQQGNLPQTIKDTNKIVEHYNPEKVAGYLVPMTYDPKVFGLGHRSWAESLQGYFSKAKETKAEMFAWATQLNHPISTCVAHLCALKLEYNLQDSNAIREHAGAMRQLAGDYKFPWYMAFGDLFYTWHKAMEATNAKAIDESFETLVGIYNELVAYGGTLLIHSQFSRMITEFLIRQNRWSDALEWVGKGIEVSIAKKEFIYLAELLRLKAQALVLKGELDHALEEFKESINLAKKKGHRLFELRSRVSLCHAIKSYEEPFNEAVVQLKPLVMTFPSDSDFADLKSARELI